MAQYNVEVPGKGSFTIEAPDGAPQDVVISTAMSALGAQGAGAPATPAPRSVADTLGLTKYPHESLGLGWNQPGPLEAIGQLTGLTKPGEAPTWLKLVDYPLKGAAGAGTYVQEKVAGLSDLVGGVGDWLANRAAGRNTPYAPVPQDSPAGMLSQGAGFAAGLVGPWAAGRVARQAYLPRTTRTAQQAADFEMGGRGGKFPGYEGPAPSISTPIETAEQIAAARPAATAAEAAAKAPAVFADLSAPTGVAPRAAETAARAPKVGKSGRTIEEAAHEARGSVDMTDWERVGQFRRKATQTMVDHLASMGQEGVELSRLVQVADGVSRQFFGTHVMPLADKLRQLKPFEKKAFVQAIESNTRPANAKLNALVDDYIKVFGVEGEVSKRAKNVGLTIKNKKGEEVPWEPLGNYFIREWDPDFLGQLRAEFKVGRGSLYEQMVRDLAGRGMSIPQARKQVAKFIAGSSVRRVPGLERAREMNLPGYITDPAEAVVRRGIKVAQRLAQAEIFGPKHENLNVLIDEITKRSPWRGNVTNDIINLATGTRPPELDALARLANKVGTFEAMIHLSLAFVPNLSQSTMTALRAGLLNATREFIRAMASGEKGRQLAKELGLIGVRTGEDIMLDLTGAGTFSKSWPVKIALQGLSWTEDFNRVVAANAGMRWGEKLNAHLARLGGVSAYDAGTRSSRWILRELQALNFSQKEVKEIVKRGVLTPDELKRVAYAIADQTQYVNKAARRSMFMAHPLGRIMLQFQSYIQNTQGLLRDAVYKEARAGNLYPLATLLLFAPLAGEAVADAKAVLTRKQRTPIWGEPDEDMFTKLANAGSRYVDNMLHVGALGYALDALRTALAYGENGVISLIAGPAFMDAARIGTSLINSFNTDEVARERAHNALFREGLRMIPYGGGALSRVYGGVHPKDAYWEDEGVMGRLFPTEDPFDARSDAARARSWAREKGRLQENADERLFGITPFSTDED